MVSCEASRTKPQLSSSQSVSALLRPSALRESRKFPLHVERTDGPAVLELDNPLLSGVARDLARALHGIGKNQIPRQMAVFEQRQDAGGRAYLQRRGKRAHVRVADEQMKPAIFPVIGQRFVARVDDRAIELHPLVDVVHDVIGALAELEIDRRFRCGGFEIKRERIGLADAARAGKNLARGEKREQRAESRGRELHLALHQVILVAAEGRAGVMIDVVLDERNASPAAPSAIREPTGELIAGQIVGRESRTLRHSGDAYSMCPMSR